MATVHSPTEIAAVPLVPAHMVMGQGPVLLLVAGTGYPGSTWLPPFTTELARHLTVVTFDHRGTGRTPGGEADHTTRGFAADAIALLDHLGIAQAHVLGHSMGGRVAQWMALDAPDRITSLVLAATGPGEWRPGRTPRHGLPLGGVVELIEHGYERYMASHIREMFFTPDFAAARPDVVDGLIDAFWAERPGLRHYLAHIVARQEHQTTHLLDTIQAPSLVLVGSEDTRQGGTGSHLDQSRFLAQSLPDAELMVLDGLRHGYPWEAPERTASVVLEWTRRHPPQS